MKKPAMNIPSPRHLRAQRAFTLVEVSVAIGVVSFAMIAMLGLIPVGLTTFQEASTLSVRAQIVQSITSEIGRSDSAHIKLIARPVGSSDQDLGFRYYDNEGNKLESKTDPKRVYTALVETDTLDQLSSLDVNENSGQRVTIKVTNIRTEKAGGVNAEVTYPIIVPNT